MLRKTLFMRIVSLATAIVLVCSCILSASAVTNTATKNVTQGSNILRYRVTSTTSTDKVLALTQTQALHTKGIATTIGIASSVTKKVSSSASVSGTVGPVYVTVSLSLAKKLGDAESASYTVGTSVQYTIPATTASGRYRIEVVFPQDKVSFSVVQQNSSGGLTPMASGTITTMPRRDDSYRRLNRYADP